MTPSLDIQAWDKDMDAQCSGTQYVCALTSAHPFTPSINRLYDPRQSLWYHVHCA